MVRLADRLFPNIRGRETRPRFLYGRAAESISLLLVAVLGAALLSGCLENPSTTIPDPRVPGACREGSPPDAPYTAEALQNISNVSDGNRFSKSQINAIFSVLADAVRTYTGEPYATAHGRLFPEADEGWTFEIEGSLDNSSLDRQRFGGTVDGTAQITRRDAGGGAIPPRVVNEAERILHADPRWDQLRDRSGNRTVEAWSPSWPSCLLFRYERQGEYGSRPYGGWAYIHHKGGYVPEQAVCIEPTETLRCAEYI